MFLYTHITTITAGNFSWFLTINATDWSDSPVKIDCSITWSREEFQFFKAINQRMRGDYLMDIQTRLGSKRGFMNVLDHR